MTKTNISIVEGYIEEVLNQKQFERAFEYCSRDCVTHSHPYVGLGVNFDDTSGERLVLAQIAPHSPADGRLEIGDELIRVKDGDHIWETFNDLRSGLWAQGVVNTELTVTVRRRGNLITIPLTRSQINAFDLKLPDFFKTMAPYIMKNWPDLKSEIKLIFGNENMVACYMVNSGTSLEYGRSAIWGEIDLFKLERGKITEIWGVENSYSELKQLGFQITEPVRELA